jgi:phosphoribosylglycinamide formyltransferase-1
MPVTNHACVMPKAQIAVLISGNGSNLQALIDACQRPDYPAEIALVISNNPEAYGLVRAEKAGIATTVLTHRDYASREAFDDAIDATLREHAIRFVCLAGFMRILSARFVARWEGRMINIHPSLLPKYPGLHTHERAIANGDSEHGCTVHWVTAGVDEGPIIGQAACPLAANDTPQTLKERVHQLEHALYVECLMEALTNQQFHRL